MIPFEVGRISYIDFSILTGYHEKLYKDTWLKNDDVWCDATKNELKSKFLVIIVQLSL
jgi:hypothetical protein